MDRLKKIWLLSLLITLNEVKKDDVLEKFLCFLNMLLSSNEEDKVLSSYSDFVSVLNSMEERDFSKYLKLLFYKNKNLYATDIQSEKELEILSCISQATFSNIQEAILSKFRNIKEIKDFLPVFENSNTSLKDDVVDINVDYDNGLYRSKAFIFDNDLEIKPVDFSENIKFSNLKGYNDQKKVIFENTKSFLENKKVNNILLYGDAGCGKSSTVRALLNEFKDLKMIQVFKNNLINLDKLFNKLKDIPHKFVIFADDISFDDNDDMFSTMKAVLDGSLVKCPDNAVIYATSNRKHLVRETFQSREGDEIHLNDTVNELNSLSDRFGINLLFKKPTTQEYIDIVLALADDNDINLDRDSLIEKAKKTAIVKGSTSPRVARQLIDNIVAYVNV